MGKIAQWGFEPGTIFDGIAGQYDLSVNPRIMRNARRLVVQARAASIGDGVILARGGARSEDGAFQIMLTAAGAIRLTYSGAGGKTGLIQSPDGLIVAGERFAVMLSWPQTGAARLSAVVADRPDARFQANIPAAFSFVAGAFLPMSLGAAIGGTAPFFHGEVFELALWDRPESAIEVNWRDKAAPAVHAPRTPPSKPSEGNVHAPAAHVLPSFAHGTKVTTPNGERTVEGLRPGDLVITRANGPQPLTWVGHAMLDWEALRRHGHLRPVLIRQGALGTGLPERDMQVSPNHRLLVDTKLSRIAFDKRHALVAAKHLVDNCGIYEVEALGVTYVRLMFAKAQVICTNGVWSECFQPADPDLHANPQRLEFNELFPELSDKPRHKR